MSRTIRGFLIAGLLLFGMASVSFAAAPTDLIATKTASEQTTLKWTVGTGTDTAQFSLDGLTWTAIAPAAAGSGVRFDSTAVPGDSKVIGLTDFTNYYFSVHNDESGTITLSNVVDAFPPNEHAHRYFASDTNQCSRCHSTHVAAGARLLKAPTVDDTCKTCHVGTGSKYQVDAGTADTASAVKLTSPAGAFGTTVRAGSPITPTSAHSLGALINTAPGGDPAGTGAWVESLGCGSCHSAHTPRSGTIPGVTKATYQYRLLKWTLPNMKQSNGTATPTDLTTLPVEAYAVTLGDKEGVNYVGGLNNFCGGCHADYNSSGVVAAGLSSGKTQQGIFDTTKYRHATGRSTSASTVLPKEGMNAVWDGTKVGISGKIMCSTCHFAHATSSANADSKPDGTPNHSRLLRLDNRAVCQTCHNK